MAYFIIGTKDDQDYIIGVANDSEQAETFRQQYIDENAYPDHILRIEEVTQ
jgi:hypothetical protein